MNDCLFCKIVDKKIPAKIRYEDEHFLAFDDINSKAKTHILLIPKRHIASMFDIKDSDQELMGEIMIRARDIAKNTGLSSFRLVINSGEEAGQEVKHIHAHILGGNKLGDIA